MTKTKPPQSEPVRKRADAKKRNVEFTGLSRTVKLRAAVQAHNMAHLKRLGH